MRRIFFALALLIVLAHVTPETVQAAAVHDFHDAAAHWTTIGKAPPLEIGAHKNAIWAHPGWQS